MKVSMVMSVAVVVAVAVAVVAGETAPFGARQGKLKPSQLLKSYQGFVNDFVRTNDAYKLEYHVGDSSRLEQRTNSGEVTGTYAFVAPEGDEYEFKYEANSNGYNVESDALPQVPEDTDAVKAARDAFFEAYEKQVELTKDYDYSEESDESDESGESSEESSEEDSDEESSEESDESSEESDEDDEDYEDEEVEVEEVKKYEAKAVVPAKKKTTVIKKPSSVKSKSSDIGTSFFTVPSRN